MIDYNIEDLVRKYVNFRHGVAGDGWNLVYCEVCGDGSRTKGPRGGWLFNDGGDAAVYHCFNDADCEGNFSINREQPFSKNMRNVFDSFGIPSNEYNMLLLKQKKSSDKTKKTIVKQQATIELPDHFKLVKDLGAEASKPYRDFLRTNYGLSTKDYSFYAATGLSTSKDLKVLAEAKSMKGRLVVPYYKNGSLIYFQARDITDTSKLKYLSPNIPKNNILFNIDQLWRNTDDILYVVEGAMDAIHLSGVATLGNELSSAQAEMLSNSKRRKVLVPDFKGDSHGLMEACIDLGWEISIPEYRKKYKDTSEAIVAYGKLYTAYDIVSNIKTAKEAKILCSYL